MSTPIVALNDLLSLSGIAPAETLVARHTPKERALRRVMPWLVAERPDLFAVFQALQAEGFEKAMTRATYMASFLENGAKSAIFAGLYRIEGHRRVTHAEYWAIPENQALQALGMDGMEPGSREPLLAESAFAQGMPDWQDLVVSWAELQVLPASWRNRLSEWRGVYIIFDVRRVQGYVGSAYGQENILGRWRNYAATGHGGNVKLQASDPADLRFSILQRASPDLLPDDVIALEGTWKARLHTRTHGLNVN